MPTAKADSTRIILLSLLLLLIFSAQAPAFAAQEKIYEIADLKARLELLPDGSYRIREEITYDFQVGSFTFAVRDIPLSSNDGVSTVSVRSSDIVIGDVQQEEEGSSWRVRWEFPPTTGLVTFVLEYELSRALRQVDDDNEIFWRVVGEGWGVPFRQVEAEIVLPARLSVPVSALTLEPDQVATVAADGGDVVAHFAIGPLPAGQAYQVRVSFPKVMEGRSVGLARPGIQALLVGVLGFFLFLGIGAVIAYRRGGVRLPPRPQAEPAVDIPSAAVLLHRGSPGWDRAFPATLFDLANRGAVSLERIDHKKRILTTQKVVLRRNREVEGRLTEFEEDLLTELETYREDLKEFASAGKKFRAAAMKKVRESLVASRHLADERPAARQALVLGLVVFLFAIAVFVAGVAMGSPWLMASAGAGVGAAVGCLLIFEARFPATRKGAEDVAALKGYLQGLRDKLRQRVKENPVEAAQLLFSALPWLTLDPKYRGDEAKKLARALKKEDRELRAPPWALDRTRELEKATANKSAAYVAFMPFANIVGATSGAVAPSAGAGGAGGAAGGGAAGGGGGGAG